MARKALNLKVNEPTLEELIPSYGEAKEQLAALKKETDLQNLKIKDLIKNVAADESGKHVKTVGDWTATLSYVDKSTMNEEKLIEYLKKTLSKDKLKNIIKKREYVDGDALESAIYNGILSEKQVAEMETCKDQSTSETLRITKKKEKGTK